MENQHYTSAMDNLGKTTRLMEEAVERLAELPDGFQVFVTGPHTRWLIELSHAFRSEGLMGVRFLTPFQIMHGELKGRRGILLIDDLEDFDRETLEVVLNEKKILESYNRR